MLLVFWGMIGNWTDKFGFKTVGEIVRLPSAIESFRD